MPLFKRKPFPLAEPPEDIRPNEQVFQIRFTKEIFRDYKEYLERINHYRQRVWVCKVSGKTNLTYEEALVSERRATEKVQHFPKELIGSVLRMVQFKTLGVKELVSKISNSIKDFYLVGEEVTGRKTDSLIPCKILKVIQEVDDEDGTFKYEVGWLDKNKKVTETSTESAEALVRKKPLVTQEVLKSFIRESTSCSTPPWVVHDELARKYRISTEPPEDLKDKIIKQEKQHDHLSDRNKRSSAQNMENGDSGSKKRKRKETEQSEEGSKPKKKKTKETEQSEEGSKPKKKKEKVEEQPKVEPIKYPIEDSLVQPGPDDPVFTERPCAATDFLAPMDCVGDVLMVWDFCTCFGKALHLWPFSLEDFEKAIDYREGDVSLLAEAHCALLRIVAKDSSAYQDLIQKRKAKLSIQNWQDHLCYFLEVEEVGKLFGHLETIRCGSYSVLDPQAKLDILHELVNRALTSDVIRGQLDEYIEERQVLAATKREEQMGESRRKKEEHLKQLNGQGKDDQVENATQEIGDNERAIDASDSEVLKCAPGENGLVSDDAVRESSNENGTKDLSENHYDNGDGNHSQTTTSRQAALKQKLDAKAAEEREKEMARTEEQKKLQEKRKAKAEIMKEQRLREQRALEMQKRQEQLDREIEKRFIRTNSLGRDRAHNRYWFFRREGRLFVEKKDSTWWGYYSAKEELDALIGSLNPKGEREMTLQRQLEKHYLKISNAMQRRSKDIAQKFAFEEAALRRSTRVRTQPKAAATGFLTYVNKHRG